MLSAEAWKTLNVDQETLDNRQNSENLIKIHGRGDVQVVPTLTSALSSIIGEQFELTIFDFTKYAFF